MLETIITIVLSAFVGSLIGSYRQDLKCRSELRDAWESGFDEGMLFERAMQKEGIEMPEPFFKAFDQLDEELFCFGGHTKLRGKHGHGH